MALLADTRAEMRATVRQVLALDPQNTPAHRLSESTLVAAWEAANEYAKREQILRAEARTSGEQRAVTVSERASMRRNLER
eukprot:6481532-Amphidinium_carterae.1